VASVQSATPAAQRREKAVRHLFEYLDMRPGVPLVAYERAFAPIARELLQYAAEAERPLDVLQVETVDPATLHERLTEADKFLCAYNRTFATGFTPHVEVMSERAVELAYRAYTITDLSEAFFDVFQECPSAIQELNETLIRVLQAGTRLEIADRNGTELVATLHEEYDWVNMDGFSEADFNLTCNLPVGEVASYSGDVEGTVHFTGALLGTIPIGRKHGAVTEPIQLDIVAGRVERVVCSNRQLKHDLEYCLYWDEHTAKVNELGFGTNSAVPRRILGFNYKYEENRVGFHLGFGASLAQQNVERLTPHHLDLVFDQSELTLDGEPLFRDGEYRLAAFAAASGTEALRLARASCCPIW
jgi:leucyl aminopeptidase (aminopeptidase T)